MEVNKDLLKETLKEIFNEIPRIDARVHMEHHEFVDELIKHSAERERVYEYVKLKLKQEEEKQALKKKIFDLCLNYAVPAVLASVFYFFADMLGGVGSLIKKFFTSH